ncbi:unnamed protein product, partial [Musa banksii]
SIHPRPDLFFTMTWKSINMHSRLTRQVMDANFSISSKFS